MTIPKIIHHIWMGNNAIPDFNLHCANSVKEANPAFEYILWRDGDVEKMMKTDFPDYCDKFNELPRMIMKVDMFRYFLMYKYGGLYTDMDYLMFKPFDLLHEKVVIPCNRDDGEGNPTCLGNCIFASQPNHPYWKSLMDTLFTIDRANLLTDTDVLRNTGPSFVFNMWKKYAETNEDVCVPQRHLFHPPTNNNQEYIDELKRNGCYGMHACTGLWRGNNF